jgi:hypothetical protein
VLEGEAGFANSIRLRHEPKNRFAHFINHPKRFASHSHMAFANTITYLNPIVTLKPNPESS